MTIRPIPDVASDLGIPAERIIPYGRAKAKVELAARDEAPAGRNGRLVLVSAINPTPGGEGKTTMSIALAMGMRRLGTRVALCLREPSLGPVFGVKGGGTGGGAASLHPADDINLHFTGDLHAITSANNLLAAIVDNALHFRSPIPDKAPLDSRRVTWARALDMNDRSLRNVVVGLGNRTDGMPRQDRFDITAASEVMAILALASSQADLEARIARTVVGYSEKSEPITAADLGAASAMAAVLRDALMPNLVQTKEGGAAFVHAGPFANIAHGCSSVVATDMARRYADYVVTEAGFGFDLGGEKFLDIKCRALGAWPRALVLVATLRALKLHGGAGVAHCKEPNAAALEAGIPHLLHHTSVAKGRGLPTLVVINRFPEDTEAELALVETHAKSAGVKVVLCEGFAKGGEGAIDFARAVVELADSTDAAPPEPRYTYELTDTLEEKITKVARTFYGARGVELSSQAKKDIARIEKAAAGLPVCIAKTQMSLSHEPDRFGCPRDFDLEVRELRHAAGAGFVVAITGDMMTMPGLPREPAAKHIHVAADGRIRGLMQND